jgi:hypothetical protein
MKEVFIVSENEQIFTMFSKTLSYMPVHFSWVGDMDTAEKQFRNEKPDFVFFAVHKLTLLHHWVAQYKSFKLRIPFLCFISKIGWEKRELLWMAGAAEVIELPKLNKEFKQIVESVLLSAVDDNKSGDLSGSLNLLNVINLIQTFEDGKKNGIIKLISKNRVGELQFYKGKLVNAVSNSKEPLDAVLYMSLWREGVYTISLDKLRHNHRIKLENKQIVDKCQENILTQEKLLNSLPDREAVFYAAPLMDYEEINADSRRNLLFFKQGKSINDLIENDSEDAMVFLKGIENWINKKALLKKEEYQEQLFQIKEEQSRSGVKKIINKIFSKQGNTNPQTTPTENTIKKSSYEISDKKPHLFDRYELLKEFVDILENED